MKFRTLYAALTAIEPIYENLQNATTTDQRSSYVIEIKKILETCIQATFYYEYRPKEYFYREKIKKLKDYDLQEIYLAEATSENRFDDGINRACAHVAGLYFLGEVTANPLTSEMYYWVKIGISSDLKKRTRNYDTHCPTTWRIDYSDKYDYMIEAAYHLELSRIAISKSAVGDEWFLVDRETYLEMCEKGFGYFNS